MIDVLLGPPEPIEGVLVLGANRSGTSALAGALVAAGIHFGDVMRDPAPGNARGYFEHPAVNALNRALLQPISHAGPRAVPAPADDVARRILRSFNASRIGIKDPMMLYCAGFWCRRIASVRLVATFRHPLAVIDSVRDHAVTRGSTLIPASGDDLALATWISLNERLLALRRQVRFPVLHFDAATYADDVGAAVESLGLRAEAARASIADGLVHHRARDTVPVAARAVYDELRGFAAEPIDESPAITPEVSAALAPEVAEPHLPIAPLARDIAAWQQGFLDLAFAITERDLLRRQVAELNAALATSRDS